MVERDTFESMFEAIALCRDRALDRPLLVLIYTLLDTLAWTIFGEKEPKVKKRFVRLCEDYLLPGNNIECTAYDLYAARCSFLHTLGWESDLSLKGDARSCYYFFGAEHPELAQKVADQASLGTFIGVDADNLIVAAKRTLDRIRLDANANDALAKRIFAAESKQYESLEAREANQLFGKFLAKLPE